MKILQVVHGFPPECSGGTESYLLKLARELKSLRHQVEVLTGSHEGAKQDELETSTYEGITVHKLRRGTLFVDNWDKSYAPEIEGCIDALLRRFRPDVVHVHHWLRLSRHLIELFHDRGIPAVCTLHDLWSTCPIAFRIRAGSFCSRPVGSASCHDCAPHAAEADDAENAEGLELFREDLRNEVALARRVIVPSAAHRSAILAHHPDIAGTVRVIPHGSISDLAPRARHREKKDPLIFGHWGHLSSLKGIDLLLEAAASLPPELKQRARFEIFGTIVYPGERARIEELVKRAPVTMHGAYTPADLPATPMDLAVIPTRCSESYSFVLDEAFQLGLPAIVPARGALAERIGRAGATFAPESAADLARVLAEVIRRPDTVDRWRGAIPASRSFGTHAQAVAEIYREVCSLRAPLAVTPLALRSRRAAWRSKQVEARTRRLEFKEGDLQNALADVARATQTMQDMQRFHVEKDRVIAGLEAEKARVVAEAEAEKARRHAEAEAEQTRLLAEAERLRSEIAAHAASVEAKERELSARPTLGEITELRRAVELSDRIIDGLTETLKDLDHRARHGERATTELDRTLRALDERTSLASELKARLHDLESRALAAEGRGTEASERLESLIRELGRAQTELNEVVVVASEREEGLRAEIRTLSQAIADATTRFEQEIERRDLTVRELAELIPRPSADPASIAPPGAAQEPADQGRSLVDRVMKHVLGGTKPAPREATPLKVLYVLHQFLPRHVAGTEIYTGLLAREMKARGHRVVILTCEAHHDLPPFQRLRREWEGIPIHEVVQNYRWDSFEETYDCPRMDRIFEAVLDEEKPDVVHVQHLHYFSANFLAIAHRRGLPIVYTLHDYSLLCARDGQLRRASGEICLEPFPQTCADCITHQRLDPAHVSGRTASTDLVAGAVRQETRDVLRRVALGAPPFPNASDPEAVARDQYVMAAAERIAAWRDAAKYVDLFVSPSHFLRSVVVDAGFVAADRIIVSDNGQDTARFSQPLPRQRAGAVRFGFIGTIAEHKGVQVLIDAMNGLVDDPRAECQVWGDLRAFIEVSEALSRRNQNPRTRFMGHFAPDEAAQVLAGFDVLVVPSLWFENAPLTVHEALMARVPVIASDQGGLAEFVIEGRTGLHFFLGDAEDLRKKLLWFMDDPTRVERFDFGGLEIVPIADDAARTETRYRNLLAART